MDLEDLVRLQTGLADRWHNTSQGFRLEVEEDVDCACNIDLRQWCESEEICGRAFTGRE